MTQFLDEGIVFPCAALPAGEALALEPAYYKLARRMSGWTNGAQILKSHLVSPWVCELVHNPAMLDVIEGLIGPDILCWSATFFAKEAGSDGNFVQEPRPQGDFDAAGIDAYKAALLTPSGIGGADDSMYNLRPNLDHIK